MSQGEDRTPNSDPPPYSQPEEYGGPPPYAAEEFYGAPPPYAAGEYYSAPPPYMAEESYGAPPPYMAEESYGAPPPYSAERFYSGPPPYAAELVVGGPPPYRRAGRRGRATGWSMWRFNGSDWEMIEDRSQPGASPSMPSPSRGKFVGQVVRTPSLIRRPPAPIPGQRIVDDAYAMSEVVRRAGEVPGYGSPDEMRWIAGTAASLPAGSTWVEVGTFCGRSFLAAGLSLPQGSTLMTVDVNLGQPMRRGQSILETYRELSHERQDLKLVMIRSNSVEAAKLVPNHSCAVVYIDGDHSGPGVHGDVHAWMPKLVRGGMLSGHDYGRPEFPGVTRVVDGLPGSFVAVDSIWVWYP